MCSLASNQFNVSRLAADIVQWDTIFMVYCYVDQPFCSGITGDVGGRSIWRYQINSSSLRCGAPAEQPEL